MLTTFPDDARDAVVRVQYGHRACRLAARDLAVDSGGLELAPMGRLALTGTLGVKAAATYLVGLGQTISGVTARRGRRVLPAASACTRPKASAT